MRPYQDFSKEFINCAHIDRIADEHAAHVMQVVILILGDPKNPGALNPLLKMAERKRKKKNVSYSFVFLIPVFRKQDLNNIK